MEFILASNSPRRKQLLEKYHIKFTVVPSLYEEKVLSDDPILTTMSLAEGKAREVFERTGKNAVVLGADTVVYFNNKIIGKPRSENEAVKTLKTLSGNTHSVVTGYAFISETGIESGYAKSRVRFNELSEKLIADYVRTGLPMDKAGAYGIQDGFPIVNKVYGSIENVIGLPAGKIIGILKKNFNSLYRDILNV